MLAFRPHSRWFKIRNALERVVYALSRPNTYVIFTGVFLLLILIGTFVTWALERQAEPETGLQDWGDAFIFILQNVSGVGIGAKPPATLGGRSAGVIFVILAAAARAFLLAAIVSFLVNRVLVQGKGLRKVEMENHVIICGWNSRVTQMVEVLQREAFGAGAPLVLLASVTQNPLEEFHVKFIKGDPSSSADLTRADVGHARAAIVVTDESDGIPQSDSTYDARSVLTVLAVKAANSNAHIVAQVRDPHNRPHFQRARADEIIASAEMSEGLLARAALNVGIASVFSDLLRLDTPQELYVIDAAADYEGKTFQAALVHMQVRDQSILVGVVEGDKPLLCPPSEYKIHSGTRLVVLGLVRPKLAR